MHRHVSVSQATGEAIHQLLNELQILFPEAAQAGLQALRTQQPPTCIGGILASNLQALQEQTRQAGLDRCRQLQGEIGQLKQSLREQEQVCKEQQTQINQLQGELTFEKEKVKQMQHRLSEQNRLLADQHVRLMEVMGHADNDDALN